MGWKTQEMLDGLPGIMNLAAASGEDLARVSDIVTDGLTALGLSAKDSAKFADVLAAAASNSNTNISMMGETMTYAAPIFGTAGYNMKDLALASGLMANAGIKASNSGTALRMGLTRMVAPPKQAAAAMDELGLSMTNADGTMKPFMQVVNELREKFSGLSKAEQMSAANAIFSKTAMGGWLSIINASPKDFAKLQNAIENSNGAAENMADIMNNTLSGQFILLKSALEGIAIQIGDILAPYFKKFVGIAQELAMKFSGLSERAKKIVIVVAGLVAGIGPLLLVFGGLISLAGGVIGGITAIAGVFATIGPVILPLIAAIPLLTAHFVAMATVSASIGAAIIYVLKQTGALNTIFGILKETFKTAKAVIQDVAKNAFEKLKLAIDTVKSVLDDISRVAKPFIDDTLAKAKPVIQDIVKALGGFANALIDNAGKGIIKFKEIWDKVFPFLEPSLKTLFGNISNNITTALNVIKKIISATTNLIKGDWSKVWGDISSICKSLLDNITNNIKNIFNLNKSIISKVLSSIKETITNKVEEWKTSIVTKFTEIKTSIVTKFTEIKTSITAKLTEWWTAISTWFTDLPSKIKNKLNEWKTNIVDKFAEIKTDIINSLGEWWNAISQWFSEAPSNIKAKLIEWRTAIVEWTKEQNEENKRQFGEWWTAISEWFTSIPEKIRNKFEEWKTAISDKFIEMKNTIAEKINEWWTAISEWFTSIPEKIKAKFEEWKTAISDKFIEIKNTIAEKINEWWTAISEWFTSLPEKISTGFSNVWESVKLAFDSAKETIKAKLEEWWTAIKGWFAGLTEKFEVKDSGKKVIKKITDGLHEQSPDMMDKLGKIIVDATLAALAVAGVALISTGREIIKRIISGVDAAKTSLTSKFSEIFNSIKSTISGKMQSAVNAVSSAMSKIKSALSGFKFPKIPLPHFTIKGKFDLAKLTVPKLSIDWYAKGGIFNAPQVIGVGEKGSEAVLPIEKLDYIMANALTKANKIQSQNSGISSKSETINFYGDITIDASKLKDSKDIDDIINIFRSIKQEATARGGAY